MSLLFIIKGDYMKILLIAPLVLVASNAMAWDCSLPQNFGLAECASKISAALKGVSSNSNGQSQGQGQYLTDTNTLGQGQTATGGNGTGVAKAGSESTSGAAANNAGNKQISNSYSYVQASAPPVINPVRIVNCGVAVDAGGSGVRGAGAFGITMTTEECWNSNYAAMEEGAGRFYDACIMRRQSKTEQRAVKNGAKFEDCAPTPPVIIEKVIHEGPSPDEIEIIREQAVLEYINTHPEKPCGTFLVTKKHHKPTHESKCKKQ